MKSLVKKIAAIVFTLFALGLALPTLSPVRQENKSEREMLELKKKWFGVKSWAADYTETFNKSTEWEIRPGVMVVSEVKTTSSGHFILDDTLDATPMEAGNIMEWYGYGSGDYHKINTVTLSAQVDGQQIKVTEVIETKSSGRIGIPADEYFGASLSIDVLTGGYAAGFGAPEEGKTTLTRKVEGLPTNYEDVAKLPPGLRDIFLPIAMGSKEWATFSGDINDTTPLAVGLVGYQLFPDMDEPSEYDLPESGMTLADSYHGKYVTRNWRLTPAGSGEPLVLKKCDSNWLPEDGNSVRIAVEGDGHYGHAVKLRFKLFEVTNEIGTCLNSDSKDDQFDLDFYHQDNSETKFKSIEMTGDGYVMETNGEVKNAVATVSCNDYGAWGKLMVEVGVDDYWQPLQTADGENYITIPLDEAGDKENKIADRWEELVNDIADGSDPMADNERIDPSEHRGDGLTLYEEYRGFEIGPGNRHVRTNPWRADLFVYVQSGNLRSYVRKAEDAVSTLKVHLIEAHQFVNPGSRVINPNRGELSLVEQHGLYITDFPLDPGVLGIAYGSAGSPGECSQIMIDVSQHYKDGALNADNLSATVVHEMMHGCGVRHHGKDDIEMMILDPRFNGWASVAQWQGVHAGDVVCTMCYTTADFFTKEDGNLSRDEDGGLEFFEETTDLQEYGHLCTDRSGTGPNTDGGQVGDAVTGGGCAKNVRISDVR